MQENTGKEAQKLSGDPESITLAHTGQTMAEGDRVKKETYDRTAPRKRILVSGKEQYESKKQELGPGEFLSKKGQKLWVEACDDFPGLYYVMATPGQAPGVLKGHFTGRLEAMAAIQQYIQVG